MMLKWNRGLCSSVPFLLLLLQVSENVPFCHLAPRFLSGLAGSDQESTMAYDKSKELVVGAAEAKSGPTYGSTGSPTSRARTGDQIKDEDDEDENVEAFKDNIMKQLEESAFSIEEAHNILAIHFGSTTGDPVKDVVLAEWCGEVGISKPVAEMKVEERLDALDKVAKWLFQ